MYKRQDLFYDNEVLTRTAQFMEQHPMKLQGIYYGDTYSAKTDTKISSPPRILSLIHISYNEYESTGTGFSFTNYNAHEMLNTIRYAEHIYYDRKSCLLYTSLQ